MIVYNHENYLKEAIAGVLAQKTNFPIELIISNDASTDSSSSVIQDQVNSYIGEVDIRFFDHKENKGMLPNFSFALDKCDGKYIAFCEGDDYWTDPEKLQKQVEFMEGHPDYNICFHPVRVYDEEQQKLVDDLITREVSETTDVSELVKGNYLHTPSVLLKNNFVLPSWVLEGYLGDWVLYMVAVQNKKIKKLEELMAVYRKHSSGIWSGNTEFGRLKKLEHTYTLVRDNVPLNDQNKAELNQQIEKFQRNMKRIKPGFPNLKNQLKRVARKMKRLFNE